MSKMVDREEAQKIAEVIWRAKGGDKKMKSFKGFSATSDEALVTNEKNRISGDIGNNNEEKWPQYLSDLCKYEAKNDAEKDEVRAAITSLLEKSSNKNIVYDLLNPKNKPEFTNEAFSEEAVDTLKKFAASQVPSKIPERLDDRRSVSEDKPNQEKVSEVMPPNPAEHDKEKKESQAKGGTQLKSLAERLGAVANFLKWGKQNKGKENFNQGGSSVGGSKKSNGVGVGGI